MIYKYQYCTDCDFGFYIQIDNKENYCPICNKECNDNENNIEYSEYILK